MDRQTEKNPKRRTDGPDGERDRQSVLQRDSQSFREIDSLSDRQKVLQEDGEAARQSFRETAFQIGSNSFGQTDRQTESPSERQRVLPRQTVILRDRQSFQERDSPSERENSFKRKSP